MRRRVVDTEGGAVHVSGSAPTWRGRRSRRAFFSLLLLSIALSAMICSLLVLGWIAADDSTTVFGDDFAASDAWLNSNSNQEKWQRALLQSAKLNLPVPHSVAMNQVFFISCNRHDRSQLYWAYMAVAAQCEMLSWKNATAAPPCRRLYAGVSSLLRTAGTAASSGGPHGRTTDTDEGKWQEAVPLGACGSVYDSPAAAEQRQRYRRTSPPLLLLDETPPPLHRDTDPEQCFRAAPRDAVYSTGVPVDALIWLGDIIYADKFPDGRDAQSLLFHHVNTMVSIGRFWRIQRDAPEYNAFIDSCVAGGDHLDWTLHSPGEVFLPAAADNRERVVQLTPSPSSGTHRNVWATWDDHDMGENDGGREYTGRNSTQRFFLNFLRAPSSDPRWRREGVYGAYTTDFRDVVDDAKGWGTPMRLLMQQLYEHAICVVLLDVRSFRDRPNATQAGDMLGAEQWAWFEELLQNYTTLTRDGRERCAMVLIGGGIQFILDEKPAENWAAFPRSRDRLLGLLQAYRVERVAFITGDVHMGELGADFTKHAIEEVLGYPIVEATSSGLTHSANMYFLPTFMPLLFPSPRRLGLYVGTNFGALRLSLDLRHLPLIRSYLTEMEAKMAAARFRPPQWRREVRAAVEQVVNATFTIFSIPKGGQPVYRLNFPLSMLTYAHGVAYRDATVDAVHGSVHKKPTSSPAAPEKNGGKEAAKDDTERTSSSPLRALLVLKNGTITGIAHYRNTEPTPLITWSARQLQYYIFTNFSVSETLKLMILLGFSTGALVLLLLMTTLCRYLRRPRNSCGRFYYSSVAPSPQVSLVTRCSKKRVNNQWNNIDK
ncbi:PhoD-like phosphatase, putative [Leishmania donovani]|uniref:PhoD-like phosphatase, putative n=1 Tax=Leishmania donovani TaxID=5661 RepID=A0A3S7WV71_LEIDO|nr:PhoD-like phosphatase, putative [Leishmania donovani]